MSIVKISFKLLVILWFGVGVGFGVGFGFGFVFAELKPNAASEKETLGRALYFDVNLSKNRSQSCATCHAPEFGFVDPRKNASGNAVSLGDDGKSLGDRNAPTASYAAFIPEFKFTNKGVYNGGQFYDGREANLKGQAGGPPLNSIEMGMPDKLSVMKRIQENEFYVVSFKRLFTSSIFESSDDVYEAMTESIAAFEKSDFFSPFDSKYDRYLQGKYQMTEQEDLGMTLFFSQQFTNCNTCHQLKKFPESSGETFSNYDYHNIGVPVNISARSVNGVNKGHIDRGLLDNPMINDVKQAGKFKVPTLRNVAITGPYMHNGVFNDLKTVMLFYNKYNTRDKKRQINPESGKKWRAPEVLENISLKELEAAPALDDKRINALVAFMKTLTDQRYEYLIK